MNSATEFPGFIIERTAKKMKLSFSRILARLNAGITVDQWVILAILNRKDGISQNEICEEVFKDAPTVTRILDLLEKKGIVERKPDVKDRRRFKIYITSEGKKIVDKYMEEVRKFRKQSYESLTPQQLEQLQLILDKIYSNLNSN